MKKYDFETFLSVRIERGDEIRALCPFHDDRNPSFSANTSSGLWICHAGCGQGCFNDFLNALRGRPRIVNDLRAPRNKPAPEKQDEDWGRFSKVDEYDYLDYNHHPRLRIIRLESPEGEKRFVQKHLSKKGYWQPGGVGSLPLLPFRYEDWFIPTEPLLFLVEGEKCVRFLMGMRFQATTFVGGANGWKAHYATLFKGRDVVILPDNDSPGREFALNVLAGIKAVTRARILELPGLGVGGDVFDWFKAGNSINEFRELIEAQDTTFGYLRS